MDPIIFTDAAAAKVKSLLEEEENPNLKLRVFLVGGGCSGFQYRFAFTDEVEDDDFSVENNGVMLLVDSISMQYMAGAEVDYAESLQSSQFVIRNPSASTTCGCGASFSV